MGMLLHAHVCPAHHSVTSVVSPLQSLCSAPHYPQRCPCHPHLSATLSLTGSPAVTCS